MYIVDSFPKEFCQFIVSERGRYTIYVNAVFKGPCKEAIVNENNFFCKGTTPWKSNQFL